MKKVSKALAVFLSVCLLLSSAPLTVFAETMPEVESVQIGDININAEDMWISSVRDLPTGKTVQYGRYEIPVPQFTVKLKDGTELTSDWQRVTYNGRDYFMSYTDPQSPSNPWTPGNTYTIDCTIMGYDASFRAIIGESAVKSLTIGQVNLYEGPDSRTVTGYSEQQGKAVEYTYYQMDTGKLDTEVIFNDGTKMSGSGGFRHNGKYYSINTNLIQSADAPLSVGDSVTALAFIGGVSAEYKINICENPVQRVTFDDVEVIESKTKCNYSTNTTVYFKDGTQLSAPQNMGISFEGGFYTPVFSDTQDAEPWIPGSTYQVTGTIMGVSADFSVKVLPTPIQSIRMNDIIVYEQLGGYLNTTWVPDPENPGQIKEESYYKYSYGANGGTVIFADGTVQNFDSMISYGGKDYYIDITDNQQTAHWTAGNTYHATASVLGASADVPVTVKEIPYTTFTADDVIASVNELNSGNYAKSFHFVCADGSSYDVSGRDCTVPMGNMRAYSIDISGEPHQWAAGETYTLTATLGKLSATFCVTAAAAEVQDGYSYLKTADGIVITDCFLTDETVGIPAEIAGTPVIGINSLEGIKKTVITLTIPDGIKFISDDFFKSGQEDLPLKALYIGKDVQRFDGRTLKDCKKLENITVSKDNPTYCDEDGVLFNKGKTVLVWYPPARDKRIVLPATVEDFSVLYADPDCYGEYYVVIDGDGGKFVTVDGVTYSSDMTVAVSCDRTKAGNYVMPETVTYIKASAFSGCRNLTGLTLPEGVTQIAYAAFADCTSLKDVSLPDSVEAICEDAFRGCTSLESIALPANLSSLEERAFYGDTALRTITFPEASFLVGPNCFANTGFTDITVPANGFGWDSAFYGCTALKKATVETGIDSIAGWMFGSCTALDTVTMPSTIESIGGYAFSGCTALKGIKLSSDLTTIGSSAFAGSGISSIALPDSVTSIGSGVFEDCGELKTAVLGTGLNELPEKTFAGSGLEKITIPENVCYIGEAAFSGCRALSEATVENKDVFIAFRAFENCPLKEIPISENATGIYAETYTGSAAESVKIPDTVTEIMFGAFRDGKNLLDIQLPANLGSLGEGAFDGTAWLRTHADGSVCLGDGDFVFYGYKGDAPDGTCIKVKDGTKIMAEGAFENGLHGSTSGIVQVVLPDSLTAIPPCAFLNCENIKSVVIGSGVHSIGGYAFSGCTALTDIYYCGTEESWNRIEIGDWSACHDMEDDSSALDTATVHFIDSIAVTEGDASVYRLGSKETVRVRSSADIKDFERVEVDGVTVAPENYDVTSDATVITLKSAYTETLAPGEHIVAVVSATGTAYAGLKIITQVVFRMGDVNHDGEVDALDATQITRYSNGKSSIFGSTSDTELEAARLKAGDVNGDGEVDALDATQITRYSNGKPSIFDQIRSGPGQDLPDVGV